MDGALTTSVKRHTKPRATASQPPVPEEEVMSYPTEKHSLTTVNEDDSNSPESGFLSNLEFQGESRNESEKKPKPAHPAMPPIRANPKKSKVQSDPQAFGDLFVNNKKDATPVLGADRRSLLTRISQYKICFEECAKIKVPANASDEDLAAILEECGVCVSLTVAEKLLGEALLGAVEVTEVLSSPVFDIRGTAAKLRMNPSWNRCATQLWIRYGCFSSIPAEYQMIIIFISTAVGQFKENRQFRMNRLESYT